MVVTTGEVTIETVSNEGLVGGTFTAIGDLVCPSGDLSNLDFEFTETLWWFEDDYTCADGTGSFVVRAELPLDPDNEDQADEPIEGTWTVVRGTGEYHSLIGSGTIVSTLFIDEKEKYAGHLARS